MKSNAGKWVLPVVLWSTALGCVAISGRLGRMGTWQPRLPATVGGWSGTTIPLSLDSLNQLGNPRGQSLVFRNAHGESVAVHLLAPSKFQGFGELAPIGADYRLVAQERQLFPGGRGSVTATAHESLRSPGLVVHTLRWLQLPSGKILPFEPDAGSSAVARLLRGFTLLTSDPRACAVHVTTMTSRDGASAGQVRRNLREIASAVLSAVDGGKRVSR